MLRAFFLFWLAAMAGAEELTLVQFSDIHSGGPHFSQGAFEEACRQGLALNPQAVVLTGDHGDNSLHRETFDSRIMEDIGRWKAPLAEYSGQIFLAAGNDDVVHNYQTQPADLRVQARAFEAAFGGRNYLDELGNGLAPSRLGGFRWISLNSQIFSPVNKASEAPSQAEATFQWLQGQLKSASDPVVLVCHIPPSWDLYMARPSWRPEYLRRLAAILDDFAGSAVVLCGHYHRNHVQGMRPDRPIPILTAGALATKYDYASNWRHYRWQVTAGRGVAALSYTLHFTGHPEWTVDYQLRPDRLGDFLDRLRGDADFYRGYVRDVYGHHPDWEGWAERDSTREKILEEFWVETGSAS